jgi:hypothetical protein
MPTHYFCIILLNGQKMVKENEVRIFFAEGPFGSPESA